MTDVHNKRCLKTCLIASFERRNAKNTKNLSLLLLRFALSIRNVFMRTRLRKYFERTRKPNSNDKIQHIRQKHVWHIPENLTKSATQRCSSTENSNQTHIQTNNNIETQFSKTRFQTKSKQQHLHAHVNNEGKRKQIMTYMQDVLEQVLKTMRDRTETHKYSNKHCSNCLKRRADLKGCVFLWPYPPDHTE